MRGARTRLRHTRPPASRRLSPPPARRLRQQRETRSSASAQRAVKATKVTGPRAPRRAWPRSPRQRTRLGGRSAADRVEGDHSAEEVVEALGGVSAASRSPTGSSAAARRHHRPGSATVTQVLAGTYFAVNTETGSPPDRRRFVLRSHRRCFRRDGRGRCHGDRVRVRLHLRAAAPAGKTEIASTTSGPAAPPAGLEAEGDATAEDALAVFKTEKGKPPLSEKGTQATAVVEGGEAHSSTST